MDVEIILVLLFVVVLLVALANKLKLPYPILLVLAGLIISFVPAFPDVILKPELVFILFLPPIIQLSAFYTSARDFRANIRSISLLAVGLVLATMVAVALVAHALIKDLPWGAAFALGAIVGPTDSIAATSIAQRLGLPRRIVTVLEGESLLNDATALVAYRVAVAAVVTGTFSLLDAGGQFLLSSIGGIGLGIVLGLIVTPIFRRLNEDVPVYLTLTFLSGYGAYLLADALHFSGVLAVATIGIFYGQPRFNTMTPTLRIQGTAIWDIVVFVLNGLIFILVGLQLNDIVKQLPDGTSMEVVWYAILISLTLIVVRFIWVFAGTYLPRLPASVRARDPFPHWQHVVIVSWAGMRGGVSLATALALPFVLDNKAVFPQRSLIIFLTFCVILATLVLQGLTLPFLIKRLNVVDDGTSEREEHKARLKAAQAAQAQLTIIAQELDLSSAHMGKLMHHYEDRIRHYTALYHGELDADGEDHFAQFGKIEQQLLKAELDAVLQLRNDQVINDEILRRVQYDLDLEWLRLQDN
ncbi:Na+/H+ antiporter [Dictyobacter alpinus]|uniref:Na+/H+ antiporter n=1 Tax=Dictyobacter alpinus TaxID=2014873 RepID=A0A402BK56_9CHLR|nr:Na+/H+ antiporter [Dictyobacter alpinus]GCE31725.1 Na+/H+ antiporter [Dictyobacter alpinus]